MPRTRLTAFRASPRANDGNSGLNASTSQFGPPPKGLILPITTRCRCVQPGRRRHAAKHNNSRKALLFSCINIRQGGPRFGSPEFQKSRGAFMSTSLRAGDPLFITFTRVNKNTPTVKVVANHKHNSTTATYLGMAKLPSVQILPARPSGLPVSWWKTGCDVHDADPARFGCRSIRRSNRPSGGEARITDSTSRSIPQVAGP